jgi:AcrR family transcriptional regulator
MGRPARLPSRERRDAIVAAVRGTFAEKGFEGTTTRELAEAAGVSEALLYKHFPSKESLHAAMLETCTQGPEFAEFSRTLARKPSTATLARLVHLLVSHFVLSRDPQAIAMQRLALRSLLEDADLVRLLEQRLAASWVRKVEACLAAAARAGDLRAGAVPGELQAWFAHHLAFALMLHLHPRIPPVDYGVRRRALVRHAVRFVLRGMGLKNEAIRRCYRLTAQDAR